MAFNFKNLDPDIVDQIFKFLDDGTMTIRDVTLWLNKEHNRSFSHSTIKRNYEKGREAIVYEPYKKPPTIAERRAKIAEGKRKRRAKTKARHDAKKAETRKIKRDAERKIDRIAEGKSQTLILEESEIEVADAKKNSVKEVQQNISWRPHDGPQTEFLASSETDILYGGQAGGGKSDAMVVDPLRFADKRAHRALILRRTLKELRELINKSREYYPLAYPGAKFKESEKTWHFPSGATIEFNYLEKEADVYQYQGQEFSWIGFDEITQLPSEWSWNYLSSRLRTKDPEIKTYLRCIPYGDVLTESGWKDITKIKEGELIQSVNTAGNMELKRVTKLHKYEANEKLVQYRSQNLDMIFTQDHRLVYQNYKGELEIRKWVDTPTVFKRKRAGEIDKNSSYTGQLGLNKYHYLMLLGIYLAEGSINHTPKKGNYKVIITQNKKHTQKEICILLDKIGVNYCVLANGDIQITKKEWWEHFKQFGYSHEKYIPRNILENCDYMELDLIHKWMMKGDGHWQTPSSGGYYTNSPQLSDDFDELCVKLGYRVSKIKKEHNEPQWRDKYSTHFCLNNTSELRKAEAEYIPYKGKVYCLTIEENENFVVRQNGKVWVSGNCTANPGGVGHEWVKKRYIDPEVPNKAWVYGINKRTGVQLTRKFIPAKLSDNPTIYDDGEYEAHLQALPEIERRRLLDGDWDVISGAAFPEFNNDSHVIEPFTIPRHWRRVRGVDYGYSAPSCCVWGAIDPEDGTVVIYRELYEAGLTADELGERIKELEKGDPPMNGVIDYAVFNRVGYQNSIGQILNNNPFNLKLRPANKDRKAGKVQIHERLSTRKHPRPSLQFTSNCVNCIRELKALPLSEKDPEDVDTHVDDHAYDAIRYLVMSLPKMPTVHDMLSNTKRNVRLDQPADPIFGY